MVKKYLTCGCIMIFAVILCMSNFSMAAEKDTLVIGIQDETGSIDPAKAYPYVSMGMVDLAYERLIVLKEDDISEPEPWLAESWEIKEDGKTWLFHLRQDATFASGAPVNADAVVFSLRRAVKLEGDASWLLTQFGMAEDTITKADDDTVQIVLDKQYAPNLFLACLVFQVASIIDPLVMEHEQDGDMGSAWLENNTAGSGPYVLKEAMPGEQFVFAANDAYWKGKPLLNTIEIKLINESFEQAVMLERGDIDVAWNLDPSQIKRLVSNPDIQTVEIPTLAIVYFQMNLGYEPLAKSAVRDAIRYAIDYDGLIEYILQGAAQNIQTFIPKGLLGYNPSIPYTLDIEKARQLMAEAGYADGFEVELALPIGSPWEDIGLKLKTDLAQIGIAVTLKTMQTDPLWELNESREHQMLLWDWLTDYADPDGNAKAFAHSESLLMAWFNHYGNEEVSTLIDQAAQEKDRQKRAAMYKVVTDTILDDGPYAILYTPIKEYGVGFEAMDFLRAASPKTYFPPIKYTE